MSIYHAYDIRGEYPKELNENITYKIARTYVLFLKPKTVVVGRDARLSSPALHKVFVKGLIDQGAEVIDIGLCTTPMLYFAISYYNYDCGAMITASHLPKEFNGIKLCREKSIPISYEEGINKIEKLVEQNNFPETKKGRLTKKNILNDYRRFILKNIKKTNLKVIVDAGNMMGSIDGKIISKVAKVIPMFFKIDPTFPNRGIDTSKEENTIKLRYEVIKQKADLGIAFDGDADRVAFVDNKGRLIPPAIVASLLMLGLGKPNSTIVHDLTISSVVKEQAEKFKLKTIMTRVGHTYVSQEMRKHNAIFGVERSGHYFFKYNFYMDSGLYTAIKMIQIISKTKQSSSQLVASVHQYPNDVIYLKVKNKDKAMNFIAKLFYKDAKKVLKLDGISIYHSDYWLNIRKSNTEDALKIVIEANTRDKLAYIKNKIHLTK